MKKKIISIIICLGVLATIGVKSISANAKTMTIKDAGIKEYNGVSKDQAFAWTSSNEVGFVDAIIEVGASPKNYFLGYKASNTGWVQTNQVTYPSSQVRGNHWAGVSGEDVCDSAITYP